MTYAELKQQADARWQEKTRQRRTRVILGESAPDYDNGGRRMKVALEAEIARRALDVSLERTGNFGMDWKSPLVTVIKPGKVPVWYGPVLAEDVPAFVDEVIAGERVNTPLALFAESEVPYQDVQPLNTVPWFAVQQRVIMEHWGHLDPESIWDYIANGGYAPLQKVMSGAMTPEQVIEELKASGLTGRGGAYFPTGVKWEGARRARRNPKFVMCNCEEGEPAIYKDRRLLESNPHQLVEGMLLCAFVIGAHKGYCYIGEHPLARLRFAEALRQANEVGVLGKNVLGFDFECDIEIRHGAGSYVSGESSAMQASIEGGRAMPRVKLARSVESGLWELPTCANNVETLAFTPLIADKGGAWFAGIGNGGSKGMTGTKMYSLTGHLVDVGLVEVPFGLPVRHFAEELCGGTRSGKPIKTVIFGGPTGGPIPPALFDTPADPHHCGEIGVLAFGAGGVIVLDESACLVDTVKYFMAFMENQSCGKCTPCRIGCHELLVTLQRISEGRGTAADVLTLEDMGDQVAKLSICGHGQAAPYPVFMVIQHWREELDAHISDRRCPAGVCKMVPTDEIGQGGYLLMQPVRVH
ncbi:MAG TPA: NADH-ubiquinone oxidoreductase-F iron-sulfur binding region domain-containing protein [Chloroflexota bacterium]|nr:NADH-ubiquinone oxidoreductase-F iron-sulfur binding region domain-containing protein [Chloroflexota bacterium]